MIYPDNFEQKIGFDTIRRLLGEKSLSPLGKEHIDEIRFTNDVALISRLLSETDEFVSVLNGEKDFPVGYFLDMRFSLQRIRPEGTFLDEKELFDLKRSLQTIYEIVRFFEPTGDEKPLYPALYMLAGDVPVFPRLIQEIDHILDKYGRVKDNASSELMRIRRELSSTMGSVSRNLQSILRTAQAEGVVDKDVAPTMRDGRLVIPVSPAFKRKIRGIVHDESATGKTVFIEPEAVVEANNRIRELEGEERREIVRILMTFTDQLRPSIGQILYSYKFLGQIDLIRSKALFAQELSAIKPEVAKHPKLDWVSAVHPLLFLSLRKQQKKVVPLDIELTEKNRILVISGPNAGGKSVCLKTVGLLQYMMQCGLLVPLRDNSQMGVFEHLFIDIGDEQSIEDDLSTYSSHLSNMKYFVRHNNERTLFLIDEFGSGTEPQIGGAIAESLLERFNQKKSYGVVTTHYQNLKHQAEDTEGMVNGAMLYDRHLMQPLFKLSIGNPGSSFAVEIARKIGLPEDIIQDASDKVGSEYVEMDKYLQDIVRDKRYWETKRQNIRQQEKKLEQLMARYEEDLDVVNKQRKEVLKQAKEEAKHILSDANARIENTIREIKETQAEKEKTRAARKDLETYQASLSEHPEEDEQIVKRIQKLKNRKARKSKSAEVTLPKAQPSLEIQEGDLVRLKGQTSAGTVLELKDKQATVAFGMIKSTVKVDRLEKVSKGQLKREETRAPSQQMDNRREKLLNFKQDIDVRGMRGDEAVQAIVYYIDDAMQAGVSRVRILHGTGTGILRTLIREYLSGVPGVARYHDEHVQFGGAGITVVELE